jgi:hypothetical protein
MSREIRRVPPDWEHPRYNDYDSSHPGQIGRYMTLHDNDYQTAALNWIKAATENHFNFHPDLESIKRQEQHGCQNIHLIGFYWEYDHPPDPDHHRARVWTEEEATHYQMYETVSEGTPVTPVFATLQELEDWLVEKGEMHGSEYEKKYSRAAAKAFCEDQWAASMVIVNGVAMTGVDYCAHGKGGDDESN